MQNDEEPEQLRKQEAEEVLARIKDAIAVYSFTAAELGVGGGVGRRVAPRALGVKRSPKAGKKAAVGVAPKYRDQNGNVWGGRGPRPAWFKAALEAGTAVEDLLTK